MQRINRVTPKLPVTAVKTYGISSPQETHSRPATCAEVGCAAHAGGWVTTVDERTPLGRAQASHIRRSCVRDGAGVTRETLGGRRWYRERKDAEGRTLFTFPAGQTCFAEHVVSLDRPELFVVRDGDWRGNPTGRARQHTRAADWVEDFGEHQLRLVDQQQKG